MALIEVDDAELQRLRNAERELAQAKPYKILMDKMGAKPETRIKALKLIKEINPEFVVPELDAAAPLQKQLDELQAKLLERDKKEADTKSEDEKKKMLADAEARMDKGRKWLKEIGYQDEGIKKIEDLMEKRGIPDYEAAEAYFAKQNPPEDPIVPGIDFNRGSGLFEPPEGNPWKDAVSLPRGQKQHQALRVAQAKEINGFFDDIGRTRQQARR